MLWIDRMGQALQPILEGFLIRFKMVCMVRQDLAYINFLLPATLLTYMANPLSVADFGHYSCFTFKLLLLWVVAMDLRKFLDCLSRGILFCIGVAQYASLHV